VADIKKDDDGTWYYVADCGATMGSFASQKDAAEYLGFHILGCGECL
jgi:hypothetical protein